MSRSQTIVTNPSERTFRWAGKQGLLTWYDKENKRNVPVRFPFEFMVLDELSCIVGFCKPDNSPYYSNDVRNTAKEPFTVKTTKGIKQTGLYRELADVRGKGAKYAKSIYIAHKDQTGNYVIGNFKAVGSALSAWFDFCRDNVAQNGKIRLTLGEKQTAATGDYYPPVFTWDHTTQEEDAAANALDHKLQEYFSEHMAHKDQTSLFGAEDTDTAPEPALATREELADFERRKEAMFSKRRSGSLQNSFLDTLDPQKAIDLRTIPF